MTSKDLRNSPKISSSVLLPEVMSGCEKLWYFIFKSSVVNTPSPFASIDAKASRTTARRLSERFPFMAFKNSPGSIKPERSSSKCRKIRSHSSWVCTRPRSLRPFTNSPISSMPRPSTSITLKSSWNCRVDVKPSPSARTRIASISLSKSGFLNFAPMPFKRESNRVDCKGMPLYADSAMFRGVFCMTPATATVCPYIRAFPIRANLLA
mmetsp:Transcript_55410/g.89573  ORF Transcript_55410/g.89573 Transcript_55410/m.89573 type:complete len:209 (-) Transcript_55410:171-797(-)